jgi:aspartate/tyrosine/aromatic aminotransferase
MDDHLLALPLPQLLVAKLKENGSTKDWSHITDQIGMFGKCSAVRMAPQATVSLPVFCVRVVVLNLAWRDHVGI